MSACGPAGRWVWDGLMLWVLAFLVGAAVGSFLNVCIWRIPAGQSIVYPPSRCRTCGARIRLRDNVPLLSYILLRGRCRSCHERIALRYPVVEALAGVMGVLLLLRFEPSPRLAVYAVFVAALIVISFIDLDHQIIPDVISLPGIVIGLLVSAAGYGPTLGDAALGAVLGGGVLYAVAAGYYALTGREGMGGGDIKLLAMVGAFLGWRAVLVTLVLGSFTGAVVGLAAIIARGADSRMPIPFGPFLALGAVCALFFGHQIVDWYLRIAFLV
jgi:leader peptidase (prepilin peptidase)/N-methyltransferase